MKTLDKFRSTHKFCIHPSDVKNMSKIIDYFEDGDIVGIANNDPDEFKYTVRVNYEAEMVDYVVEVSISTLTKDAVKILDHEQIRDWETIEMMRAKDEERLTDEVL